MFSFFMLEVLSLIFLIYHSNQVIVTERAGHAFDVMASIQNKELHTYDGIIAVVSCRPLFLSCIDPNYLF